MRKLTFDEFKEKALKKHGDRYAYFNETYVNTSVHTKIQCNKCGNVFMQKPNNHLNGQGCPKCHVSEIENDILVMLEKHNIKYQLHKRNLEYLNGLELDFYLPDYNVAIECQGEQHFKPVEFFGGKDKFKETNANDTFKRNKCKENGIKLLYYSKLGIKYPYKVFEDKEKLLKEIING